MMGHVTCCLPRPWQGWVTRLEDVVFLLRLVGSYWHIESRGVTGSHFSFKTSLWLLSGEWPVGGESEVEDQGRSLLQ